MKYFLDTEFIESGPKKPIQLISLGMVREDGAEFYVVSNEFHPADANDWMKENVLKNLEQPPNVLHQSLYEIALAIKRFVGDKKPEFWGYYADYDWVVFCQIFGSMVLLPEGWPIYCRDLKQWSDDLAAPKFKEPKGEHNALIDARWNLDLYHYLSRGAAQGWT